MDERQIIKACQSGEMENFSLLYDTYVKKIYDYLYYRLFDVALAEDLSSTIWLKALESIQRFDPDKAKFSTWLYTIARNTLIDHYRVQKPTADATEVEELKADDNLTSTLDNRLTLEKVRKYLDQLPANQKEVVLLRVWDGLSHQEIASLLEISEANSKVLLSRALSKIQQDVGLLLILVALVKFNL